MLAWIKRATNAPSEVPMREATGDLSAPTLGERAARLLRRIGREQAVLRRGWTSRWIGTDQFEVSDMRERVLAWHYAWTDQLRISWPTGVPFSANFWEVFSREQLVQIGHRACEQSGVTIDELEHDEGYQYLRQMFNEPRRFRGPGDS